MTDLESFMQKYEPEPNSGCWIWTAALRKKDRYGIFKPSDQAKTTQAHRSAYRLFRGEIPNGLQVLHRCDVPSCVNPAHLFLGTNDDNRADSVQKGRVRRGERHHNAKVTAEQVKRIRERRARGARLEELATAYGVDQSLIGYICRRRIWTHL